MAKNKDKGDTAVVDEDVELEELDDDEVEETPTGKGKAAEVTFGVADLAAYLAKKTGKNITAKSLRVLIRKMAREENARVKREVIPGNKSRYDWPEGLQNVEVKKIIKAVTAGELEQGQKEALAKLKEQKAAKQAAAEKGAKGSGKKGKKGKAPAPVEDEVEEIEDFDDDED